MPYCSTTVYLLTTAPIDFLYLFSYFSSNFFKPPRDHSYRGFNNNNNNNNNYYYYYNNNNNNFGVIITDLFSGRGRTVGPVFRVCLCVWTLNFVQDDVWSRYLTSYFISTLPQSSSTVKGVIDRSSRRNNVTKVVSATSTEGISSFNVPHFLYMHTFGYCYSLHCMRPAVATMLIHVSAVLMRWIHRSIVPALVVA